MVQRKKTKTGKKLTAEGKVAVPAVTRGDNGKLRATTEEEKKKARTTVLKPAVPKEDIKPVAGSRKTASVITSRITPVATKGAASGNYPLVKSAVDAARTHLTAMSQHPAGSPEHHAAHEAFNAIHSNIGKLSPELHTTLGQAKHFVTNPGKGSDELLAMTHKAINTRLNIIKTAHEDNIRRADEGRKKKAGN